MVFSAALDPAREVVVEADRVPGCLPDGKSEVRIVGDTPNSLDLRVAATTTGWLVIADVWYPGWKASVDGQATPLWRANYLFRALLVPAGEHLVSIVYRPFWFYLGALVSAMSWLGLGIYYGRRNF